MRIRSRYPFGGALAVAAVAALTLAGCQATKGAQAGASGGATSRSAASTVAPPATKQPTTTPSGTPATGALPDVCAMLSRFEVSGLVGGKPILAVSSDPGPNSSVRYCQWQMSGAQVVIQLSSTTETRFRQDHPNEPRVDGLGDDAFFYSNHLFVRKATIQIDVYASTVEGPANDQKVAKAAAGMAAARL
jgi:hypothetical protein